MIIQVTQGIYLGAGGTTRAIAEKLNHFSKIDNQIFLISVDENQKFDKKLISDYRKRFNLTSKIRIINLYDWLRSQRITNDLNKITLLDTVNNFFEDAKLKRNLLKIEGTKIYFEDKLVINFFDSQGNSIDELVKNCQGVVVLYDKNERAIKRIVLDSKGRIFSVGTYNKLLNKYSRAEYYNYDGKLVAEFNNNYNDYLDIVINQTSILYLDNKVSKFSSISHMEYEILNRLIAEISTNFEKCIALFDETSRVFNFGMNIEKSRLDLVLYNFHSPHWNWENYDIAIPFNGTKKHVLDRFLDENEKITVLTQGQKDDMLLTYSNLTEKDIYVVDNFLHIDKNTQIVEKNDQEINIISVGRLSAEKNVEKIIEAFVIFTRGHINSKLHVVGGGVEAEKLKLLVEKHSLTNNIIFYGNSVAPWKLVPNIDFSVNASNVEGYGLIFPESISRGIPVVAWNSKYGAKRWIKEGVNGLLSDRNIESLAQKFEELYKLNLDHNDVRNSYPFDLNETNLERFIKIFDI